MAQEAKKMSDDQKAARTYMASDNAWEQAGEEYGGQSEILMIEEGEVAGPLTYIGHQEMTTDLGDTTVHMATNTEGGAMRLPIQATFLRAIDQAGVHRGDTFLVRRDSDTIKARGKGQGKPMAIYAVKVISRVPQASAPAI